MASDGTYFTPQLNYKLIAAATTANAGAAASGTGAGRTCAQRSLSGGAAEDRVLTDSVRRKYRTYFRCYVYLGKRASGAGRAGEKSIENKDTLMIV